MGRISLIFLIANFIIGFCNGQNADTLICIHPEVEPSFKYDTCTNMGESLKKYFMDNYIMPNILLDNGYTGIIIVELVIERDSSISNIKLVRGMEDPLDESVLEKIQSMPKWCPGIDKGKTVRTKYTIPISIHWLYGKEVE
jgi:hypothetical protein